MFTRSPLFGVVLVAHPPGVWIWFEADGDPRNGPARSDLAGVRCIDRRPGTRCPGCYLGLLCPKPYRAPRLLRFPILASAHLFPKSWLALARSDWLSTESWQPFREPWCPSFAQHLAVSRGHVEPLVPPLIPGAGTGDLFGGAWRIGTLDQLGITTCQIGVIVWIELMRDELYGTNLSSKCWGH